MKQMFLIAAAIIITQNAFATIRLPIEKNSGGYAQFDQRLVINCNGENFSRLGTAVTFKNGVLTVVGEYNQKSTYDINAKFDAKDNCTIKQILVDTGSNDWPDPNLTIPNSELD